MTRAHQHGQKKLRTSNAAATTKRTTAAVQCPPGQRVWPGGGRRRRAFELATTIFNAMRFRGIRSGGTQTKHKLPVRAMLRDWTDLVDGYTRTFTSPGHRIPPATTDIFQQHQKKRYAHSTHTRGEIALQGTKLTRNGRRHKINRERTRRPGGFPMNKLTTVCYHPDDKVTTPPNFLDKGEGTNAERCAS